MDNLNTWFLSADQCRARAEFIWQTAHHIKIEVVRLSLARLAERYEEMASAMGRTETAA
jgi:hypothetical protein